MEKQATSEDEKPISKDQEIETTSTSEIQVTKKWIEGGGDTKIFSLKWSYDDKYLAAACESGEVRVYNSKTGQLTKTFPREKDGKKIPPFSYLKWRPQSDNYKTKNVFVTTNADGEIQHWHLASQKLLSTIKEESFDPQLYCLDYTSDASKFAVAGSEPFIKVYDEVTRKKILNLGGEELYPPGHNSRIYCVKFKPNDPQVLYSGGWDMRVVRWDLRENFNKPSGMGINGPLVCGEGIDLHDNLILTASWKENNQLQLWDESNLKLIDTIGWDTNFKTSKAPIFLYAGQFSKKDGTVILAGGSNHNEVKLFDRDDQNKGFCAINNLCREVDCLDFSYGGNQFAFSGGDGYVRVFQMNIEL